MSDNVSSSNMSLMTVTPENPNEDQNGEENTFTYSYIGSIHCDASARHLKGIDGNVIELPTSNQKDGNDDLAVELVTTNHNYAVVLNQMNLKLIETNMKVITLETEKMIMKHDMVEMKHDMVEMKKRMDKQDEIVTRLMIGQNINHSLAGVDNQFLALPSPCATPRSAGRAEDDSTQLIEMDDQPGPSAASSSSVTIIETPVRAASNKKTRGRPRAAKKTPVPAKKTKNAVDVNANVVKVAKPKKTKATAPKKTPSASEREAARLAWIWNDTPSAKPRRRLNYKKD